MKRIILALMVLPSVLFTIQVTQAQSLVVDRHVEYPTYFANANGLSIAYQDFGDPNDEAIVLVMGLGAQLIHWQDDFVLSLVDAGYRVIRFDNRDIGLSEKFYHAARPGILTGIRFKLGLGLGAPYLLDDMAADAIGLLDHLAISKTHVAGISMGGMIAQIMTANYPERILSLTSIMSSSGAEGLPEGTLQVEMRDRDGQTRDEILQDAVAASKAIYAKEGSITEKEWLARAARGYDRNHYEAGFERQFWAILDSGDRVELLQSIKQPSLVIHGTLDPLLPIAHGVDTHKNIAGAEWLELEDMGHYMNTEHHPRVVYAMLKLMENTAGIASKDAAL